MNSPDRRGPYLSDWIGIGLGAVAIFGHLFSILETDEASYILGLACFNFLCSVRRDSD